MYTQNIPWKYCNIQVSCQSNLFNQNIKFHENHSSTEQNYHIPNIANIINFELCELTVPNKLSFSSEIKFFHTIRFVC